MKQILLASFSLAMALVVAADCAAAAPGAAGVALPEELLPQLRPVVEQALRQSPRMIERNLDLVQSRADWYVTRATSFPTIDALGTAEGQREERLDSASASNNTKYFYDVVVRQPVWEWGALAAARRTAAIDRDLSTMNYRAAYRGLAAEIRANYLGLILAKMNLRNGEFQLRLAQENLDRQQARFTTNQITMGQVQQAQLRFDETSLGFRRTRADFEYALANFRILTGNGEFAERDIPDGIGELATPPALERIAREANPDDSIRGAEQDLEKAKLASVASRYMLYPKLALLAGVSRDEVNRDVNLYNKYQVDTWYAGAEVKWSIFDGFNAKGKKLAAQTKIRRAEIRLAQLREANARAHERERLGVTFSWESYRIARTRWEMARGKVEFIRGEQARGLAAQDQLDAAIAEANGAEYGAQAALASHLNTNVQYLSAAGLDPLAQAVVIP